jgi:hypothetical protein
VSTFEQTDVTTSGDIPDGSPTILDRATVDEAPLIRVEAAELLLHVEMYGDAPFFVVVGDVQRVGT